VDIGQWTHFLFALEEELLLVSVSWTGLGTPRMALTVKNGLVHNASTKVTKLCCSYSVQI
jgi:hypothetical protein